MELGPQYCNMIRVDSCLNSSALCITYHPPTASGTEPSPHTVTPMQTVIISTTATEQSAVSPLPTPAGTYLNIKLRLKG